MLVKADKTGTIQVPNILTADSSSAFRSSLQELLERKPSRVLLSCSSLEHVTSGHINLLWQARMMCGDLALSVLLAAVSDNLTRVLKVLDLAEEFEIESSSDPAGPLPGADRVSVNNGELKLEINVDSMSISAKLIEFRDFLEKIGTPGESRVELETVFYEVVTNVRLHSGLGPQDIVSFHAVSDSKKIVLRFIDSGIAFNPTEQDVGFEPKISMKLGQRRGFGLIMISRMGGRLGYERKDGQQNVLTIEKEWSAG